MARSKSKLASIAFVLTVLLLGSWTSWQGFSNERAKAQVQLESLGSLRAVQVNGWVSRLMMLGQFIATSSLFARQLELWRSGDADAGRLMLDRLSEFQRDNDIDGAIVVDASGKVLGQAPPTGLALNQVLETALAAAIASGKPTHTDIYWLPGAQALPQFDIVVPLLRSGLRPQGAIILRVNPRRTLFPLLAGWPVPSHTGESLLWSRAGDQLRNVSDLRGRPGSAGQITQSLDATRAAHVGKMAHNESGFPSAHMRDYRGERVIAVVEAIPQTSWLMVSKIDRAEVDGPARALATWIVAASALALFGGHFARRSWIQRIALALGERERLAQAQATADITRHRDQFEELVERRTAELVASDAQMNLQRKLLRTIADAIPALVGYFDRDQCYHFANAAYAIWFGKNPSEVVGRTLRELLGEQLYQANKPYAEAALEGHSQTFQCQIVRPDGSIGHTIANYIPHVESGTVRGVCVVIHDVTELKIAEIRLVELNAELDLRVAEAEETTKAKSAFLANMSHEIRTPMNAIIGLTHLMSRDAREARQKERLGNMDVAAKHLLQIINDILDLSKIEAGKMLLEETEFSLDEVVRRSFEMLRPRASEKGLELIVDTDHAPTRMKGDPTRLSQALINLLTNAVKFTDSGWIALHVRTLREEGSRVQLRFEVDDTGIGVPPDKQAGLFSAFEQADSSMTRRYGGTGLGLALTRHLAALMGGETGMSSRDEGGSRFWFTAWLCRSELCDAQSSAAPAGLRSLVVDDPDQAPSTLSENLKHGGVRLDGSAAQVLLNNSADVAEQELRVSHTGQRVLLADDNPVNLLIAEELMAIAGLDVETAGDGLRAVELATSRHYDLIVMDVQMPRMDGIEATQAIRARLGPGLPVIALTANAFSDDRDACLAAGMNDHIAKPVDPESLYATLLRWLPKWRATSGLPTREAAATAAPAVQDQSIVSTLARIDGLDMARGLAMVGGKPGTLWRLLQVFTRQYRHGHPAFSLPAAAGSKAAWAAACHALHGACGSLGLVEIERESIALESLLSTSFDPGVAAAGASRLDQLVRSTAAKLETELAA